MNNSRRSSVREIWWARLRLPARDRWRSLPAVCAELPQLAAGPAIGQI